MDTTTGIIIVLFVVTILSSLGGGPGKQPGIVTQPTIAYYQPAYGNLPDPGYGLADTEEVSAAINSYVLKYRSADEASAITAGIMQYAQEYNVNPRLVAALMARESRFNPRALSSSGAMGLGQLLPSTCTSVGVSDGFDIDQNAKGTVRYLKYLLDRFKDNQQQVPLAVAGYLEGPNAVTRNSAYTAHTRSYIDDILATYNKI